MRVETLYLMANTAVGSAAGLVFWLIAARYTSISEVGMASSMIAAASVLAIGSTIGLPQMINRFIGSAADRAEIVNAAITLSCALGLSVGVIYAVLLCTTGSSGEADSRVDVLTLIFPFIVALHAMSFVLDSVFVGLRKARRVLIRNSVFNLTKILSIFPFVTLGAVGILLSWSFGLLLSTLIILFIMIPAVIDGFRPRITMIGAVNSSYLRFSLASYLETLFLAASSLILPPLVGLVSGMDAAAVVYVCIMIVNVVAAVPDSTARSLVARRCCRGSEAQRLLRDSLIFSLLVTTLASLVLFCFSDTFLTFFGSGYRESGATVLKIFALGTIPLAINFQYLALSRLLVQTTNIVLLSGTILSFTLFFSGVLIGAFSAEGVAVAWTLGQICAAVIAAPSFVSNYRLLGR